MGQGSSGVEAVVDGQPSGGLSRPTKSRRKKLTTAPSTPLGADLPALRERVERMLSTDEGEKEMFDMIKRDLLLNYMLEVQAGHDIETNPQHSRASRKQSKEIAELLIQLQKTDGS